jgi:putative FmdB family regulatory protein
MPNYTFACVSCDEQFDKNVSYENIADVLCEKCGYRAKRLYTFSGLVWAPTAGGYR